MTWPDYIFMFFFLAAVTVVATLCARKEKTTEGYLLGGGKMPWWATAISYVMALVSTLSLVSTPGEAYNNGLRFALIELFGPPLGLCFFYIFIRFYFATKTFTPFSYLENRFDSRVRAIISGIYFFVRVTYLALVIYSCCVVFKGVADFKPPLVIIVIGAVCTFYCVIGGLKAVVWTNVLQFCIMVGGLVSVIIICVKNTSGGMLGIIEYAFEHKRGFNFSSIETDFFSIDPHVRLSIWLVLTASITWHMFVNSADQIAIQQMLSTGTYKKAQKSFITSMIILSPLSLSLWFIGIAIFTYFGQHPLAEGNPPGDEALFRFVSLHMPAPLPGLIVSSMLSAVISTMSAGIACFATVATKDFYLRFFRPNATELQQLKFSKIMIYAIGISSIIIGLLISATSSLLKDTVLEAMMVWSAIMAVIAPTFFIGVMSKKCSATHALISIFIGLTATFIMLVWYVVGKLNGNPIGFMATWAPPTILMIAYGLIIPVIFGKNPPDNTIKNLTIWTFDKRNTK